MFHDSTFFFTLYMLHHIIQLDGGEADFREPAKTTIALRHAYQDWLSCTSGILGRGHGQGLIGLTARIHLSSSFQHARANSLFTAKFMLLPRSNAAWDVGTLQSGTLWNGNIIHRSQWASSWDCEKATGKIQQRETYFIVLQTSDRLNFTRCNVCCHLLQSVEAKRKGPGLSVHHSKMFRA